MEMSLFNLPPEQFTLLAVLLGFLIAEKLDADEQNSIGNFLVTLAQVILTIAAQGQLIESKQSQQDNGGGISEQLGLLKKQLELLECQVKKK